MEKRARNSRSGKKPPRAVVKLELEFTLRPRQVGPYTFCGDCGLADGQHFEDCPCVLEHTRDGVRPSRCERAHSASPRPEAPLERSSASSSSQATRAPERAQQTSPPLPPRSPLAPHPARNARELGLEELERKLRAQGFALMVPTARRARLHVGATPRFHELEGELERRTLKRTACGRIAPQVTLEVHPAWLCRGCAMVLGRAALALAIAFCWTPRADSDARHASYHVWLERVLEAYR